MLFVRLFVSLGIFCTENYCSQNIALNRPTESSSVLFGKPHWNASKAVDGNLNQNVYCDSCLFTDPEATGTEAYLTVHFDTLSSVTRVEMYYREQYSPGCRGAETLNDTVQNHRFKGYRIELGGQLCYQDTSEPYPVLYQNNSCLGIGTSLSIRQSHIPTIEIVTEPILEICEVEVYGCPVGKYGHSCTLECPTYCNETTCNPDNGECWFGCKTGWFGNRCQNECRNETCEFDIYSTHVRKSYNATFNNTSSISPSIYNQDRDNETGYNLNSPCRPFLKKTFGYITVTLLGLNGVFFIVICILIGVVMRQRKLIQLKSSDPNNIDQAAKTYATLYRTEEEVPYDVIQSRQTSNHEL